MTSKTKKIVVGVGAVGALVLLWRHYNRTRANATPLDLSRVAAAPQINDSGNNAGSLSGTTLSGNVLTSYGRRSRAGSLS